VIFAHGSSVESANESVRRVGHETARAGHFEIVETAFLELAQPDLRTAVATLIARGVSRILIVPYFLTLGVHLQHDLPRILGELSRSHPGVEFRVTPPLDGHPALVQVLMERCREGVFSWP
jgi:sirohydrochlorin ferrochelatase